MGALRRPRILGTVVVLVVIAGIAAAWLVLGLDLLCRPTVSPVLRVG